MKKDLPKIKKKKDKLETTANHSIKKIKKKKTKKVENNSKVAEAVKKELADSEAGSRIPLKQQTWNSYLKVFQAKAKLDKKQKEIIEFCTNKSLTPPKRKQKFLNFIRNCYEKQKDVTDIECNELFDLILEKYEDFKGGKYSAPVSPKKDVSSVELSDMKSNKNKKKKLKRLSNNDSQNSVTDKTSALEGKKVKNKAKNKKTVKVTKESSEDDDEMDE